MVLAYGRDPYFAGWPDTLQLNYGHADCAPAMIGTLANDRRQCDGVRCDMAMLVLPEVIARTWSIRLPIPSGRRRSNRCGASIAQFVFMAEVYWDLEWKLQQQGFDYTYDKRL